MYRVHDKERHWTSDLCTPFKCNAKEGGGTVILLLPITLDSCRWLVLHFTLAVPQIIYCVAHLHCSLDIDQQDSIQSWTSAWPNQSIQPVFRQSSAPLLPAAFAKLSCFSQWLEIPVNKQNFRFLTSMLKWFISHRNKQPVSYLFHLCRSTYTVLKIRVEMNAKIWIQIFVLY